jgi:hypothetical protein
VSVTQFPNLPAFSPELYVPEHWGALVDTHNLGLTVFVPSQYPYVLGFASLSPGGSGPTDDWTNYFAPFVTFDIGPNFVFQGDIYLIAGDYRARNWPYAYSESIRPDSRIKNHIGVTVLPKGDGPRDQHANMLGGFQLMISRTSRNKSAAIELIRFLSSPEIQRVNAISRGYAPTRSALYKDPKILQVNPLFGPLRNVLEAGAAIRPSTAAGPQYEKVSTLYFTAMREALLGRKTANDAVRELEEQLKSLDAR